MQFRPAVAFCLLILIASLATAVSSFATTKGLSQIVTPDLQPAGDLSLSFQAQSERIGNPYELGAELGLLQEEPWLLSTGSVNWSPHSHVDPQPFVEAGYYTEHQKIIAGAIHVDFRHEALLGYAYDFNQT